MRNVEDKDRFPVDYSERGNLARHYSNVRSALTTFLLTVGLAAFTAYFHDETSTFFIVIGILLLVGSVFVCFEFSYRTEESIVYWKRLWEWAKSEPQGAGAAVQPPAAAVQPPAAGGPPPAADEEDKAYPNLTKIKQEKNEIWKRVLKDRMNWLLILSNIFIGITFLLVAGFKVDKFEIAVVAALGIVFCATLLAIWIIAAQAGKYLGAAVATIALAAVLGTLGRELLTCPPSGQSPTQATPPASTP